jgi:3-hydroxyacyl-[acyl-carrier-protein] dehydratase
MHFSLIDRVVECTPERVTAVKSVTSAEEYLQDHFPSFPVLPGVFMIEALVQAARHLLEAHHDGARSTRYVLGSVRALKYGSFVKPGASLKVDVGMHKRHEDGSFEFKAQGVVIEAGAGASTDDATNVAVSGRFTLRPVRRD